MKTYWLGEGCRNDFVIFDLLDEPETFSETFLNQAHQILMAERRDDALILLPEQVSSQQFRLKMIVLEPDRSIAAFCGNGARVVAAYLEQKYVRPFPQFFLAAHDGNHELFFLDHGLYGVDMLATKTNPALSQFVSESARSVFESRAHYEQVLPVRFQNKDLLCYFTETSEPHLVLFDSLSSEEFTAFGAYVNNERRDFFPLGININQISVLDPTTIAVQTYERGVNRITQACGTGSTSSAVLCYLLGKVQSMNIHVQTSGGALVIAYNAQQNRSVLQGPARVWQPR
ncbi:diaminopimelate epimerase [Candidatus Vecturithrix granuli]|uniref:Diaminopimelate epimerase n=1 Tax=Vecturithrix granuli TaxID=1499967 RepID=A0A081CA26_VECG1|nr:diaminopimelate epimerase [Candidatus Vecturithrix granuli]